MMKVQNRHGAWVVLVPVANLEITQAVNSEVEIKRVTLISSGRLPNRRLRFGIPMRLGELRNKYGSSITRFLDNKSSFAVFRQTGKPKSFQNGVVQAIKDELAILTLSQLGYAKRRNMSVPAMVGENPPRRRSLLMMDSKSGALYQPNYRIGDILPLSLDDNWLKFQRGSFWPTLIKILRGEKKVTKRWRKDLENASVLVGQSQASHDIPQAFLWNMIALELLLTEQGDTYSDALPDRAEAFLGWIGYWNQDNFRDKIRDVYKKRCAFVHAGRRELITISDLFFTDDLLLNLLINIVGHYRLFQSKADVVEFSKKVEAEHLLGVNVKIRPKTLRFLRRNYSPADYTYYV